MEFKGSTNTASARLVQLPDRVMFHEPSEVYPLQLPLLFSGEVICPIECVNEKAGAQAWSADSTCAWLRIISSRAVCERYGHLGSSMPDVKNFPPYTSGVSRLCSAPLLLRGCIQPGKGISSKSLAGPPRDPRSLEFGAFYQTSNNELMGEGVGLGLHIGKQIVELLG